MPGYARLGAHDGAPAAGCARLVAHDGAPAAGRIRLVAHDEAPAAGCARQRARMADSARRLWGIFTQERGTMATPSEKHEIHCEKRYLEYTETPFYRAFRDKTNPDSDNSNYAVLKRMEEAKQSLEEVERYYAGFGITPKFYSRPDRVTLEESRAFFEAHGYEICTFEEQRMMLLTQASSALQVQKCPVRLVSGRPLSGAEAQLVRESNGDQDHGLRRVNRQLAAGARVSFAYNHAEIPVSFCVSEGYGSAFYLSEVYTDPKFRRQGYGAAVILALLGYAGDPDLFYTDIFLHAVSADVIRLYEKLGFRGSAVSAWRAFKGGLPAYYKNKGE